MPEVKKDCHWHKSRPRPSCGILSELVCKKKKCSFFETTDEFKARQKEFEKKHGKRKAVKRCSRCKEVKSITEFSARKNTEDGLDCYCRECNREIMRKYLERKRG